MPTNEITGYISELSRIYQTGGATEHSYRPALLRLLENIIKAQGSSQLKNLRFTNEPKRIDCGAPDYIVTRNNIPVGYIEAKDIGVDLNGRANREQFDRYKQSLDNIIFTDYLDFHHYINGNFVDSVCVADVKDGKISAIRANFTKFEQIIKDFGNARPQGITSPADIAHMMAGKARMMAEVIEKALQNDGDNTLSEQMAAFRDVLIQDIKPKDFADVYAQTIAYGLFAARLHDESPDTFSRQKAASLIPKTNPFLRQLFQQIAGYDLDERIRWIVDDLADTFRMANMSTLKKDFAKRTSQNDPMIHFYENFLTAYDPALRKSRGVWYTPQAVVVFIVRAVDEILQKEFKLLDGVADTSRTKIKAPETTKSISGTAEIEVHKVQILDPATGTGTFLAETVVRIHERFRGQGGMWQGYVKEHLIPRLNGFEVLMAPYTMAHIKLEQLLRQTGYEPEDGKRLRVYLTNSLEEQHSDKGSLLTQFFAREANEANGIKRNDKPVMVVFGNPPYSGESQNKGRWIELLMKDYKKEPQNPLLNIPNTKWVNDDYCKFIRLGQEFVSRNQEGVLAYINNHSFIDNPTFRGMRWNLMKTFDKIYIINLHGNSKKKETCPDGSRDENVFDIQQGVSINIFVKTGRKAENALAEVYHFDIFGTRDEKYKYLLANNFSKIKFTKLQPSAPEYFFVPKNYKIKEEYEKGFRIDELFVLNGVGICSKRDNFTIHETKEELIKTIKAFVLLDNEEARSRFNLGKDTDWKLSEAKKDLTDNPDFSKITKLNYRPFDIRYTYHSNNKGFHARPVYNVMQHFTKGENIGLVVSKQCRQLSTGYMFITNKVTDLHILDSAADSTYVFPLYRYLDDDDRKDIFITRTPNLAQNIIKKISKTLNLEFEAEKSADTKYFAPVDLLDYIYAVLHTPAYREKYKEFLKIDFPRVPYPKDAKHFWKLVKFGGSLRRLHLLEDVEPQQGIADYPESGSNEVERLQYSDDGKVYINSAQYFANVPREVWEFYIGGYQPAQKWLKDRKGRTLNYEDIRHYRRMIFALGETGEIMEELEKIPL